MALELKDSDIEYLLKDPVFAAYWLLGIELDIHQRVRLRNMWFVPEVHDDAGIHTGKTIVGVVFAALQCVLLPSPKGFEPRIVAWFCQDIASAKITFKKEMDNFIARCPRLRAELRRFKGGEGYGYRPAESGFEYVFKNGNRIYVPAIGMAQDAAKLASLRVQVGVIEESKKIDEKSEALDEQILSRINAQCWNPEHPVWGNHVVHLGHAEDPATHPSYKRHKVSKAKIWDGDQGVVIQTASFRDWTPRFHRFRKDKEIRTAKLSMSPAKFAQRYGGIWEYGTEDWYDAKVMEKCRTPRAPVLDRRDFPASIFALGWDTALGASSRSDWSAGVVWRALPVTGKISDTTHICIIGDRLWHISPVWARQIRKGRDGGQLSGMIHRLHQRFQLGRIVFDPGGGGLVLPQELWKPRQFFEEKFHNVAGICQPVDSGLYPQAAPILIKWGKGSTDLAHAFENPDYMATDDGVVQGIQLEAQNLFASNSIMWPLFPEDMSKAALAMFDQEQRKSAADLAITVGQFLNIKVQMVTKDGQQQPRTNKSGFFSFEARGKKDLAYAALMGLAALLSLLRDPEFQPDSTQETECMAIG